MTTFYITNGTFVSGGTFSGSFVLDTTNDLIQSASILVNADGVNQTLTGGRNFGFAGYDDLLFDNNNAAFYLIISSSTTAPTFMSNYGNTNHLGLNGGLFADFVNGGSISPSSAPEPSSLTLLGTGSLLLVGLTRRKLLRA